MERRWEGSASLQMAALAHDLRTPMCVAAGAAQMALEAGGKDVSTQLQQILSAVRAMDGMLTCVAGESRSASVSGEALAGELAAVFMPKAGEKGQRLSIDLSAMGSAGIRDQGALTRVLANLLGNAIKYTPERGEISVRARSMRLPWLRSPAWIQFVIADSGMGMSRTFMKRMYQPHARAQESAYLPGKGLGLTIVKKLVKEMGGFIRVKSVQGKGTVFTVTVPAAQR